MLKELTILSTNGRVFGTLSGKASYFSVKSFSLATVKISNQYASAMYPQIYSIFHAVFPPTRNSF
jgi:hypothetical protein